MILNWKYCECGCKSYTVSAGGIAFDLYWDLKDGWYLTGEGYYRKKFNNKEEAEEIVKARFKKAFSELSDMYNE